MRAHTARNRQLRMKKTIVIDRSTARTALALAADGEILDCVPETPWEAPERGGAAILRLADYPRAEIAEALVGIGPGSFAGIRSALGFAKGLRAGCGCRVRGIVSAAAFALRDRPVAVVGDARRGKFWIALFDGLQLATDVFQVERETLALRVPMGVEIVSPDWRRIGPVLAEEFGERAREAPPLDAAALYRAARDNPALAIDDPLPLYLNPAVRGD